MLKKGSGLQKLVTNTDKVPGTLFPVEFFRTGHTLELATGRALVAEDWYCPKFMSSTQLSYRAPEDSLE